MQRRIVHMDLDSFFVSVERILNPSLNNLPVLVGGSSDRGVVASCSYEARQMGMRSAMPMRKARALCPQAIVVKGSHDRYGFYSQVVTEIIQDSVPVFEKASIDEFYLDLSGTDRFFGSYKLATELRQRIMKETGLPISFALSVNKTVSKIGTGQAKPNGQMEIAPGTEKEFLAPLSIRKIPMLGQKSFDILSSKGITLIQHIQAMKPEGMVKLLGDSGYSLWRKANGLCDAEVETWGERKSLSTESTFESDTANPEHLRRLLLSMTEKLCYQLRSEDFSTGCVTVKIRYSDFETVSMQSTVTPTSVDDVLFHKITQLFEKLRRPDRAVRLIGIRFSHLLHGHLQADLFERTEEQVQLNTALDKLKDKFGEDVIMRARSIDLNRRDPNFFNKGTTKPSD
jgi:DNA polymerase-4